MKKNPKRIEVKPVPDIPANPTINPDIIAKPDINKPEKSSPELIPHKTPEVEPIKKENKK